MEKPRITIGAIFIRNKELVVVRKEKNNMSSWILPGGKPNERETDLDCLAREVLEELPFLRYVGSFSHYGNVEAISPINKTPIIVRNYRFIGDSNYDIRVLGKAEEPIKEARMLNYSEIKRLDLSEATSKLIELLRVRGVL